MNSKLIRNIIGWDTINWGDSIDFFEDNVDFSNIKNTLEVGAGVWGGYSLYFSSKNIKTICSNIEGEFKKSKTIHKLYPFSKNISYEKIDVLDIGYENKFDCIAFKSMLGIVGGYHSERFSNYNFQKEAFHQISKALKKGGYLIFAENLLASRFHQFIYNRFGHGDRNKGWRYFSADEYLSLINHDFEIINYKSSGVIGFLGKHEFLKRFFGYLDKYFFNKITRDKSKYIFFCVCKKK